MAPVENVKLETEHSKETHTPEWREFFNVPAQGQIPRFTLPT